MKKLTKAASLLLAALTVAGSAATAASAADVVKLYPGFITRYNECEICDSLILADENYVHYNGKYYHTDCKENDKVDVKPGGIVVKPSGRPIIKPTVEYVPTYVPVAEGGSIYKEGPTAVVVTKPVVNVKPSVITKPGFIVGKPGCTVVKPGVSVVKPGVSSIIGGKYFSSIDAKEYLTKYFDNNKYQISMKAGETRPFQAGSYFISSDPEIAYYNYKTGEIVANKNGTATIYVCTKGGIPYFCLDVRVVKKSVPTKTAAYLNVEAKDYILSAGDKTTITATSSDGKTYTDIVYTIDFGKECISLGKQSGAVTAEKNGPVVVRAYSKSNPSVRGEVLLFVGDYKHYIYDGCWNTTADGIYINSWGCDDIFVDYYSNIVGWIQAGENGLLIPVVKKYDAINLDGEETTILTTGVIDLTEMLKDKLIFDRYYIGKLLDAIKH